MSGGLARTIRRRSVAPPTEWVNVRALRSEGPLPAVVEPVVGGIDLPAWAETQRGTLDRELTRWGALLFRGFTLPSVPDFERFVAAAAGEPIPYEDQSSPRSALGGRIYTSTEHPPEEEILLHNENSYSHTWPLRILFYCVVAPTSGGETPLADSRRVYKRIDPRVRRRFEEQGVLYVRNFGSGFGLDWRAVFQTDDPARVDAYCRDAGIESEWREGGRLRTRQVRPAVLDHPVTGERVWFNQTPLFHPAALAPAVREELLRLFAEEDLPNAVYYGDGAAIAPSAVAEIVEAYRQETVSFPWRTGDVLMLDNALVAHGRRPFSGPRRIAVGMARPQAWPASLECRR
ncbi:MAG TPA: TauD/TfdA family dioxygenase [Vicinamibacteria bacterium]|nr:TauD/TfdA family dioxygenase [Vicinamibacteria bacterium]